jgi:hypothetical protein
MTDYNSLFLRDIVQSFLSEQYGDNVVIDNVVIDNIKEILGHINKFLCFNKTDTISYNGYILPWQGVQSNQFLKTLYIKEMQRLNMEGTILVDEQLKEFIDDVIKMGEYSDKITQKIYDIQVNHKINRTLLNEILIDYQRMPLLSFTTDCRHNLILTMDDKLRKLFNVNDEPFNTCQFLNAMMLRFVTLDFNYNIVNDDTKCDEIVESINPLIVKLRQIEKDHMKQINNLEKDNIELNEQIEMYKSNNFKDLFYDTKIILIVWVAIIAILCQLLIYLLHIQ